MSHAEPFRPVVTRLPEALELEALAITEAEAEQNRLERARDAAESDEDRLRRESE